MKRSRSEPEPHETLDELMEDKAQEIAEQFMRTDEDWLNTHRSCEEVREKVKECEAVNEDQFRRIEALESKDYGEALLQEKVQDLADDMERVKKDMEEMRIKIQEALDQKIEDALKKRGLVKK